MKYPFQFLFLEKCCLRFVDAVKNFLDVCDTRLTAHFRYMHFYLSMRPGQPFIGDIGGPMGWVRKERKFLKLSLLEWPKMHHLD